MGKKNKEGERSDPLYPELTEAEARFIDHYLLYRDRVAAYRYAGFLHTEGADHSDAADGIFKRKSVKAELEKRYKELQHSYEVQRKDQFYKLNRVIMDDAAKASDKVKAIIEQNKLLGFDKTEIEQVEQKRAIMVVIPQSEKERLDEVSKGKEGKS